MVLGVGRGRGGGDPISTDGKCFFFLCQLVAGSRKHFSSCQSVKFYISLALPQVFFLDFRCKDCSLQMFASQSLWLTRCLYFLPFLGLILYFSYFLYIFCLPYHLSPFNFLQTNYSRFHCLYSNCISFNLLSKVFFSA